MTPNPTVFEVVLLLPNEERSVQVGVEEHIWDAAFTAGVVLPQGSPKSGHVGSAENRP